MQDRSSSDVIPTMQIQRDREAFLREPVGHYAVAARQVMWCPNAVLIGSVHWGTLDDLAVRHLEDVLRLAESTHLAPSCDVVVDCRDVDTVDVNSLAIVIGGRSDRARISAGRHVLIVPPGPRGLLISGALLQRHCRWRVFQDEQEALASLDRAEVHAAHAEAARAVTAVRQVSPLIGQLRRDLADDLADTSVERCARRLATSVRSLQRELNRHGTSFSKELQRARLDAALDLLRYTDLKIEAIARRCGTGTSSRLSQLVRATFGVTAHALRERLRATRSAPELVARTAVA
jgi:AraC-like DNA-binding protein